MKYLKRTDRLTALKEQSRATSRWFQESSAIAPQLLVRESSPEALRATYEMLPFLNWTGGTVVRKQEVDIPPGARRDPIEFCRLVLVFWLRELADQFAGKILPGRAPNLAQPNAFLVRQLATGHVSAGLVIARVDGNIAVFEFYQTSYASRVAGYDPLQALSASDDRFVEQCDKWFLDYTRRRNQFPYFGGGMGCLGKLIAVGGAFALLGGLGAKPSEFDPEGPLSPRILALIGIALVLVAFVRASWRYRRALEHNAAIELRGILNSNLAASLWFENSYLQSPDHQNFVSRLYSTLDRVAERVRLFFEERQ